MLDLVPPDNHRSINGIFVNVAYRELPIDQHLHEIVSTLVSANLVVIEAPPGTGKTTRAAPAILDWIGGDGRSDLPKSNRTLSRVLLIQPRRIAARAAAARIAAERGVTLGGEVGYQVRFDSQISAATRLIAMTPGILLRQLQTDSVLENVAAVVLDEFHERTLENDVLFGMLRRLQTELRPELKLVIMSATLDADIVREHFADAPKVAVVAQTFPVSVRHSRFQSRAVGNRAISLSRQIVEQATTAVRQALSELDASASSANSNSGDILVFLPGVGEISQVERNLRDDARRGNWNLLTLYGDLPPQEQDRVTARMDRRKVILSTNVAETSLTIDGVHIVIDSGYARVQRMDASSGLNKLVLEPISQASARQRTGRAGRTSAGICYRLWDEIIGRSRPEHLEPELLRVDLSGAVLQLLCWGEADFDQFPWLTAPRSTALEHAQNSLRAIGAISNEPSNNHVTELGRLINKLPLQPRLARLIVAGHSLGIAHAAALAAALLSERDCFERSPRPVGFGSANNSVESHECDVSRQVMALQTFFRTGQQEFAFGFVRVGSAKNVQRVTQQILRLAMQELGNAAAQDAELNMGNDDRLARALLLAFPDRLAKRRKAGSPRGLMVGGRGVKLDHQSSVHKADLFLCLDVDAAGVEATVRKASRIDEGWLPSDQVSVLDERFFNDTTASVVTRRRKLFFDLTLAEAPAETPADELTARLLAQAAAERFERLLPPKDRVLQSWLARVKWLAAATKDPQLPSFAPADLSELLFGWCFGMRRLEEVKALPWKSLFENQLSSEVRRVLDRQAPESLTLPTGRSVLLQYETGKPPVLAARIQEFFGWSETPRLADGRVPLLLHLLAPNGRVQQITDDLASFWKNTYPTVRKELRGRYPKHAWPENPLPNPASK